MKTATEKRIAFRNMLKSGEIIVEPQYRFPKSISPTSTMLPINKSLLPHFSEFTILFQSDNFILY